jgi:hypothetical protein
VMPRFRSYRGPSPYACGEGPRSDQAARSEFSRMDVKFSESERTAETSEVM